MPNNIMAKKTIRNQWRSGPHLHYTMLVMPRDTSAEKLDKMKAGLMQRFSVRTHGKGRKTHWLCRCRLKEARRRGSRDSNCLCHLEPKCYSIPQNRFGEGGSACRAIIHITYCVLSASLATDEYIREGGRRIRHAALT